MSDDVVTGPDLSSARVVLLGTGTHEPDSDLADVPAVRATVLDLREALIDLCGVAPERIDVVLDAASPMEMGDAVAAAAADAQDLLLLYYVGHGLISGTGALGLASRASRGDGGLEHRSLAYSTVRRYLTDYLQTGPARSVVVVLDCCFSGLVVGGLGEASDLATISGAFVLTSAGRDELAIAPPGARHTAFSGALLQLLRAGDPALPAKVTLLDAVRHLRLVLPRAGFPRPRCRADGLAGTRILVANQASVTVPAASGGGRPGTEPAGSPPFPGLRYFDTEDAAWFFGRERMVTQLVEALARRYDDPAPLVVLGASGAGKSSLLRAGLIPALGYGALDIPGSARWPRIVFTPGEDPFGALAVKLSPVVDRECDELARSLRESVQGLSEALANRSEPLVIVVDQFEEVFTACRGDTARTRFIAALCAAAGGDRPTALVVLGVQADFYASCTTYPGLTTALQDHVLVGPMRPGEVREAIEKPASLAGVAIEPGLVELLLSELGVGPDNDDVAAGRPAAEKSPVSYEPGKLPLLSHALLATWQLRGDLTVKSYQATGGIAGALGKTADEALTNLPPAARSMARSVLLRLVQVGEGSQDTRRRMTLAQLAAEFPAPGVLDTVLARFTAADSRLLSRDDGTVQLAHEALITRWPTLRGWLAGNRDEALLAQQVAEAAQRWIADREDPAHLYRGSRLALTEHLIQDSGRSAHPLPVPYLGAQAVRFLRAGQAGRRRVRRRWYSAAAAMTVLLLVAGVTFASWLSSNRQRDVQHRLAAVQSELATAGSLRSYRAADALQRGVTASWLAGSTGDEGMVQAANGGLVTTIAASWYLGAVRTLPDLSSLNEGPDGWLVTVDKQGSISLWDTTSGAARAVPLGPFDGPVTRSEFTPTGNLVVVTAGSASSADGTLSVWDLADRAAPRLLGKFLAGTTPITAISMSKDGARLYTGDYEGAIAVWNIADPARPALEGRAEPPCWPHCDWVEGVAMRADGKTLISVSVGADATATTWRVPATGNPAYVGDTQLADLTTAFPASSFDRSLISNQLDTRVSVNIGPGALTVALGGSTVENVAAALLAEAPSQATPVAQGPTKLIARLPGHFLHVDKVLFSHDGELLATHGADQSVRLWDVSDPGHPVLRHVWPDQGTSWQDMTFSPDDRVLLTGGSDGTVSEYLTEGLVLPTGTRQLPADEGLVWADPAADGILAERDLESRLAVAVDPASRLLAIGTLATETSTMGSNAQGPYFKPGDESDADLTLSRVDAKLAVTPIHTIPNQHSITALALSSTRSLLIVGTGLGDVDLWDVHVPSQPVELSDTSGATTGIGDVEITAVAASPDGRTLAVGTYGQGVVVLDIGNLAKPVLQARLTEPAGSVDGLAFSPDGTTLAVGGTDGQLRLWSMHEQGTPTLTAVLATAGPLVSAAYSPHVPLLATGAADGSVTLWDANDPQSPVMLQTLAGPTNGAADLRFSADGQYLVATDGRKQISRWFVQSADDIVADPSGVACHIVHQGLSQDEWRADPELSSYPYTTICPPSRSTASTPSS